MPARCIAGRACVPRSLCTSCGTCRAAWTTSPTCKRSPPLTDCAPARSTPTCFRTRFTSTARSAIPIPRSGEAALDHLLDSVEIAKRLGSRDLSLWFADGSNYPGTQNIRHRRKWFEEGLRATHAAHGRRPAHAGGVQTVRAGLLSHRHRRLGHGAAARASRRAARQGAGRHRPSLPGAEHRADCGVAAGSGHAGRLPLQRPPLRRRRSDHGLDRSLPGVPHLPRDSRTSNGRPGSAPTSPT